MHLQATRHCTPYPQRWSTTWTGRGPEGTQPSDAPGEWDSLCCPARPESTVGTWSLRCCPTINKEPPSVWKINLFVGKYYNGQASTVKKLRSCDSFYRSLSYPHSIRSIATLPERDSSPTQVTPDSFPIPSFTPRRKRHGGSTVSYPWPGQDSNLHLSI